MSPENERFLKQLVEYKRFPSFETALDAAVSFARCEYEKDIAALRAKIEVGLKDIEEGRVDPLDIAELKRKLKAKREDEPVRAEAG